MPQNKKNILFVINNLRCGGAEKSLISLLQTIDYHKYNVDLQLFSNEGLFLKQVHQNTTILPPLDGYQYFDMSMFKAIRACFFKARFDVIYNRIIAGYIFQTEKNKSRREQRVWKYISRSIKPSDKKYDAVFGFLEKSPIYYCVEKVNALHKIGFIHNDYEKLAMDKTIDEPYFAALDFIVTDSEECKKVLVRNFPNCESKIKIIFNIVSPDLIHKLAKEPIEKFPEVTNIISIGRFDVQKGYDLAIDALKIVKDLGIPFHWTILGEGVEKPKLLKQIAAHNLKSNITFLGIKENHYPYVKQADIYLQTSRFEGKSIAIDEAKILHKPILVTNFSTVSDQITNGKTGIVTEMNPESIADGIIDLISNIELRKNLASNLKLENLSTESEIEKLYALFENSSSKKELLFIMNNLGCGGAEKALVSLLQTIDYTKYNVDLYLFKKEGIFLNQVPQEVTILEHPENYKFFDMSFVKTITTNLKSGNLKNIWYRILADFVFISKNEKAVKEQKVWKYLKEMLLPLDKKHDVAIGFLEKTPNYFCVDKVNAKTKIGYIMNDYEQLKMDPAIDIPYFSKLDFIISDSEESKAVLVRNFPQFETKFKVIKNIINTSIINQLANETVPDFPDGFKVLSVGRLVPQKGYDLAINACRILADKGHHFKWYILGDGEDKERLLAMIKKNKLDDYFIFLGIRENHYSYLKKADIFVHTARFEGFGMVINEAKILNKPILLTNFNVAKSHIQSNYNGLICEMTPESIAENLEKLIVDKKLREQFSTNLSKENFGTEKEIHAFYKIIEN
ncbi:glycosyltransferase [Flavobacterium sp.]|uniref:glycosyltransferase n=1 Tax=Flavobacterium sp. TaxID=239 RepID=UPI00286C9841|nr:glycosyltransferase [Flavobacterium sp.]